MVNFNLHSPYRPPAQDKAAMYSPGQDSVISHSTAKDDVTEVTEVRDEARDIETTAAAHLKEFQDYINRYDFRLISDTLQISMGLWKLEMRLEI